MFDKIYMRTFQSLEWILLQRRYALRGHVPRLLYVKVYNHMLPGYGCLELRGQNSETGSIIPNVTMVAAI